MIASQKIIDISANVWINANAGSGKTRALVRRFFALVFGGGSPYKIVIITYTKNAAKEIQMRIGDLCHKWLEIGVQDEVEMLRKLEAFMEYKISLDCKKIIDIFADIYHNISMLRVSTIHTLCGDIIGKLDEDINLVDDVFIENTVNYISEKLKFYLDDCLKLGGQWQQMAESFLLFCDGENITSIVKEIIEKRIDLSFCHNANIVAMSSGGEVRTKEEIVDIAKSKIAEIAMDNLIQFASQQKESSLIKLADNLLSLDADGDYLEQLCGCIMTKGTSEYDDGFIWRLNGNLLRLNAVKSNEEILSIFKRLEHVLINYKAQICALHCGLASSFLPFIVVNILDWYGEEKIANLMMDYDDILLEAKETLDDVSSSGKNYDLDCSIDHLMIDEAQDVSVISWTIIKKIVAEFFNPHTAQRTLFVVGDEKQSIFSFQGANIAIFKETEAWLEINCKHAGKVFHKIVLADSYRSVAEILQKVDNVFCDKNLLGVGFGKVEHFSKYEKENNSAKVDPVEIIALEPPMKIKFSNSEESQFAEEETQSAEDENADKYDSIINATIEKIQHLAANGIRYDEIMIIMRNRNSSNNFQNRLIDKMQASGIETAGMDQFPLNRHLLYWDIMSLVRFFYEPWGDIYLAGLLRSFIFNWTIGQLEELHIYSHDNNFSCLWDALMQCNPNVYNKLQSLACLAKESSITNSILSLMDGEIQQEIVEEYGDIGMEVIQKTIELVASYEAKGYGPATIYHRMRNNNIKMENLFFGTRITTAHGAKGLESRAVIILDLKQKMQDKNNSGSLIIPTPHKGEYMIRPKKEFLCSVFKEWLDLYNKELMAEEMRLLYVAMTRAKEYLCIIGILAKASHENWLNICKKEVYL